ncbi:MAG: sulfotransferase [Asgard group archaeon]|nr:sulfotransferase [Asgard group archaeon]
MKDHWIVNKIPLAGSSISNILRLLIQNKLRVHPKYWLRLAYAWTLSSATMFMRFVERLSFNRKINKHQLKEDPIFIIGHWRSGTTYMHYLFAQDESKGLCSNIEVYAPHYFMAFPKFTRKLIEFSLPETRPMDEIKINADLPGEEEHSMGAYHKYGFFHSMIFPRNFKTYASYKSFDNAKPRDLKKWKKKYQFFLRKLSIRNRDRKLVLKNPANTYRVKHLLEMYPNAKFIHLYRNPYEIYSSTIKFHNDTIKVFTLQTWDYEELKQNVLDIYKELYVDFDEKIKDVPKENWLDIKYEDFIREPMKTMEKVYKDLKIDGWDEYQEAIQTFNEEQRKYKLVTYTHSDELINTINEDCSFILKKFGYEKLETKGK